MILTSLSQVVDGARIPPEMRCSESLALLVERRQFLRELGFVAELGLLKTWFWSVPRSVRR